MKNIPKCLFTSLKSCNLIKVFNNNNNSAVYTISCVYKENWCADLTKLLHAVFSNSVNCQNDFLLLLLVFVNFFPSSGSQQAEYHTVVSCDTEVIPSILINIKLDNTIIYM